MEMEMEMVEMEMEMVVAGFWKWKWFWNFLCFWSSFEVFSAQKTTNRLRFTRSVDFDGNWGVGIAKGDG